MQQRTRSTAWIAVCVGALASLSTLLGGCGSFAFYEDTKIGINITVDPKAPDPVEVSASFKESVFALVPTRTVTNDNVTRVTAGPVLSDLDVRYGVNAGAGRNQDFLYAAITHGLATGPAATILASRYISDDQSRRTVIVQFLQQLSETDIVTAAQRLNLAGVGPADAPTLRSRTIAAVYARSADLDKIEQALKKDDTPKLPPFTPWKGKP